MLLSWPKQSSKAVALFANCALAIEHEASLHISPELWWEHLCCFGISQRLLLFWFLVAAIPRSHSPEETRAVQPTQSQTMCNSTDYYPVLGESCLVKEPTRCAQLITSDPIDQETSTKWGGL